MDTRRLSTGDILDMGILNVPVPKTDVPEDCERFGWDVYDGNPEEVREHLVAGDVVQCSEYYGIPVAWREGDAYRGILLQYREVTQERFFGTLDECCEWFVDTARAVEG